MQDDAGRERIYDQTEWELMLAEGHAWTLDTDTEDAAEQRRVAA
jgi:hypothetical protein